jgi:hypothetical protein
MQFRRRVLPLLCLCLGGCYHANVETGRAPGSQKIEKPWAASWVGGLVAPQPVDTKSCPNGVSRVETQHSVLNQMVGVLTLAMYTPMSITVTCAAAPTGAPGPAAAPAATAQRDPLPAPEKPKARRTASTR